DEKKVELRLMDLSGRMMESRIMTSAIGENRIDLEVGEYARGIYMAALISENEQKVLKIVIQ
ncbi:MAG TPA: T9SS type A sorting domain-containing protein, partial [Bacteroidia bacterium]|nr:T9SS type A sorting domain-containing protein [Bacteroidia bacterium]